MITCISYLAMSVCGYIMFGESAQSEVTLNLRCVGRRQRECACERDKRRRVAEIGNQKERARGRGGGGIQEEVQADEMLSAGNLLSGCHTVACVLLDPRLLQHLTSSAALLSSTHPSFLPVLNSHPLLLCFTACHPPAPSATLSPVALLPGVVRGWLQHQGRDIASYRMGRHRQSHHQVRARSRPDRAGR